MSVEVGFGRGVITPALPVVLAGFGARKGAVDEVRHDLEAHAMVVRSGGSTLCLLVVDLLLLGPDFADPVRSAVGAALGIPAGQVLPSATHTHSGPAATAATKRAGWPVPPGYLEVLVAGCVEAASSAQAALVPASFRFARADLPASLSLNRRGLPYDPSFAVLSVHGPDGSLVGTLANVGIHPVALGVSCRAVSGDWVTTFRSSLTARTGAPAVLLPGALGDVNPTRDPHTHPDTGGNWETARVLGTEVADVVAEALPSTETVDDATAAVSRRVLTSRAGITLATLLSGVAGRKVEVELVEWSLGGVRLVSVPGEAFQALGRAIERSRGDRALLAGLSPVWQGYLPSPYSRGYEEKMSFGRSFVRRLSDLLVDPPS